MPDTALPIPQASQILEPVGRSNMLFDPTAFAQGQRVANLFASSQLVPQHLRGKVADCFIALHMAERLREDPLIVMQNIVIVNGRAGWMTQYMIARANRSGVFKGRINWRSEGIGDKLSVTAYATLADTGGDIQATADMAMAKAEGWTSNKKYQSMPEHMLRWRSATMLIRLYAPDVMLGIPAADELDDAELRDVTPPPRPTRRRITDELETEAQQAVSARAVAEIEAEQQAPDLPYAFIDLDGVEQAFMTAQEARDTLADLLRATYKRDQAAARALYADNGALHEAIKAAGLPMIPPPPDAAPEASALDRLKTEAATIETEAEWRRFVAQAKADISSLTPAEYDAWKAWATPKVESFAQGKLV